MTKIKKTDQEWRSELTPEQYRVLREKGTERAFTGEYDHVFEPGTYHCAGCGAELFESDTRVGTPRIRPTRTCARTGQGMQRSSRSPTTTSGFRTRICSGSSGTSTIRRSSIARDGTSATSTGRRSSST